MGPSLLTRFLNRFETLRGRSSQSLKRASGVQLSLSATLSFAPSLSTSSSAKSTIAVPNSLSVPAVSTELISQGGESLLINHFNDRIMVIYSPDAQVDIWREYLEMVTKISNFFL
jgi:hypothetical protein